MKIDFANLSLPPDIEKIVWDKSKRMVEKNSFILGKEVMNLNWLSQTIVKLNSVEELRLDGCTPLAMEGLGRKAMRSLFANNYWAVCQIRTGATPVLVDCDKIPKN